MRDIKFRGLTAVLREMVHGNLLRDVHGDFYIVGPAAMSFSENDMVFRPSPSAKVDPETIGQYTGLKNLGGVEICGGDIVKFRSHPQKAFVGVVEYSDEFTCFHIAYFPNKLSKDRNYPSFQRLGSCNSIEVLGNIHQHPELLEKQTESI